MSRSDTSEISSNVAGNVAAGVTTGVTGHRWRATITPWGDVHPWAGAADSRAVRWFVAADDRWHVPAEETAVRQRRLDGTPVVETRLRVPDGDAVQRVWSVADGGGLTVIEIENDSSRPFAVALSGGGLVTERPPAHVPIQGIELPADTIVVPVGHRSSVRVGIAHTSIAVEGTARRSADRLVGAAPASAVVSGWLTVCERSSRLVLPDATLVEAVISARCDLLLEGPVDPDVDALGFLFDVAHLTRLGDGADAWLAAIVEPVAAVARRDDRRVDDALVAVERLALEAGDDRAAGDLAALVARRRADRLAARSTLTATPTVSPTAVELATESRGAYLDRIERTFVSNGDLLPSGIPTPWLGTNFEVHGVPTSARSAISYAVRWHGERPAVLWEQTGTPVLLTATTVDASWTTSALSGEALWRAQDSIPLPADSITPDPGDDSVSFG